ncbi:hypothetical protein F0562_015834 [Nyssa sinensis]|uniref:WRC domain-containing protein n=1 Tax=Nyssa sinensis TaxID=561372 RepID=A0A5J4ZHT8_9ASTE|nr:hypothetical protein F0562_015834 [Nyssa sinensis]
MRIRKRFLSSSLSSVLLSDPQLNRSPVVQQSIQGSTQVYPDGNLCVEQGNTISQPSDPPNQPLPPPSDQQPMIGSEKTRWVCSDTSKAQEVKQKDLEGTEEVKGEKWRDEEMGNHIRKRSILGAEMGTEVLPASASSHQEVERWCEGDKVFPLKKRRGSFERSINEKKEKKMKVKMKSKTNKKCVLQNGDYEQEGKERKEVIDHKNTSSNAKKMKRGSVIMEGSRCSRVNGRGWRCCQQTLVGYSLCEHHLGKGRLRSMTSVRSRAMANSTTTAAPKMDGSERLSVQEKQEENTLLDDNDEEDSNEDEKKPWIVTKKRMKLGMVKARSISSLLLEQPNNAVVVADNNKNSSL